MNIVHVYRVGEAHITVSVGTHEYDLRPGRAGPGSTPTTSLPSASPRRPP